jgi:hypothetical protein
MTEPRTSHGLQMIARRRDGEAPKFLAGLANLVHGLVRDLVDPYRPELHYMRGPGPKWHAKHTGASGDFRMVPELVRVRVKR